MTPGPRSLYYISRFALAFWLWNVVATLPAVGQDCVTVAGIVTDDKGQAVADAALRFTGEGPSTAVERVSATDGKFSGCLAGQGWYRITVTHPAYLQIDKRVQIESLSTNLELRVTTPLTQHESIDVHEEAAGLDATSSTNQNTLGNREAINIPYQGRDIWPMLALMPGVVKDPLGKMHLGGSQINQVQCRLDGFTVTNPISGECDARLNVNSVDTIAYASGQYSTEFGKGSGGQLSIATRMGTDVFRYSVTNFVPGADFHGGFHIGSWAPRFELSGPIVKRRIWFFESVGGDYLPTVVEDLNRNNRTASLRLSNHLRTQINLTPSVILYGAFLVNAYDAPRFGLSALDPYSATVDHRNRTWFTSLKQTKFFKSGTILEVGYAENRTFAREIPQGDGPLIFTPFGREGNYFVNLQQNADRRQALANLILPKHRFLGTHQFRIGIDGDRSTYRQNIRRTGYEYLGLNNELLSQTTFGGAGRFGRPTADASAYVEDSWNLKPQLLLTAGVRLDWDELLHQSALSPRAGFAYYQESLGVRFSGGYSITRDAGFLPLFVRSSDQYSVTTNFNPDGTLASPQMTTMSVLSPAPLRFPGYSNWTLSAEKVLFGRVALKSSLMRKRGNDGLTYVGVPPPDGFSSMNILQLQNYRRDVYDSAEFVFRQPLGKEHEWQASYTRSRTLSNSVVNLAVDTPVGVPLNVGPMPWDAPNHVMLWGYFPTPWKDWSIATIVDARNGFPYSIQDPSGLTIGAVNSHRYPTYFDMDLHLEHALRVAGHRVAIRVGVTNLTNHLNATLVDNVIGAPLFLRFYGSQGRHFVVRLRWLESKSR